MAILALATLLATPAVAEGPGLKFGSARLHPYIELEPWFDSAVSVVDSGQIPGDLLFHIRPGFKFEVPSSMVAFNWLGNFDWVQYSGLMNKGTLAASHWAIDSDLDLAINRDGQIALDVGDHVVRSDRNTSSPSLRYGTLSLFNEARLKLSIRPYNGSITIEPGYKFGVEVFSPYSKISVCGTGPVTPECNPDQVSAFDYMNHTANLNGRWKFLPKTALILDTAFNARQYMNSVGGVRSKDMLSLKATIGVAGLLTTHWEVMLRAGWGQDFSLNTYSSVIGQAEVGYLLSETGSLRLGYVRTFEPTGGSTYNSFGDDRVYLDGRILLGGKLTIHGALSYDYLNFRGAGATGKDQHNIAFDLGLDYEIKPWVTVGGGYRLTYMTGLSVYASNNQFWRHEGFLKLQFIY
ncbi:MAG: outer membrane beta-barrel protein [Myxococcales bacterium]